MLVAKNNQDSIMKIKEFMSKKYWQGHRWLSYNCTTGIRRLTDISSFFDYYQAHCHSEICSASDQFYRIKPLCDAIKEVLLGNIRRNSEGNRVDLREVLRNIPILPCRSEIDLVRALESGRYYMVYWKRVILPLKDIQQYLVLELRQNSNLPEDHYSSQKNSTAYHNFKDAIKHLQLQFKMQSATSCPSNLFLIGSFSNHSIRINSESLSSANSGLLLYSCLFGKNERGEGCSYELEQINDVCKPITLNQSVFVKYGGRREGLKFYDRFLRKIRPGVSTDYLDTSYFDFEDLGV